MPAPDKNSIALNRMTYGTTSALRAHVEKNGLKNFIEEQLNPTANDDLVDQKLAATTLHIKYSAKEGSYDAVDEDRPLGLWNATIDKLWPLADNKTILLPGQEKSRPLEEVRVVSWIKAVYSDWQLFELATDFWHNHFNVNPESDTKISVCFPLYDRDVIRKNCFGNFRVFLEDVAKSTAMQFYLDNASSKASPANENYARELFELHTMGSDNYLNSLYNRWREVPGALDGKPIGYIDEDVYEAARAFTGWTVADGANIGNGEKLPRTGTFYYRDAWHDNYQKRVLGIEFDPNQPPFADGQKVLDLVAFHPATAEHICQKLCRRLVSDNPTPEVVQGATKVWIKNKNNPHQIRETLRYILSNKNFTKNWGQKVKTPFELLTSLFRITEANFTPNSALTVMLNNMGQLHYRWPTPTGHPDRSDYWLSSNTMLTRWNIIIGLLNNPKNKLAVFDFKSQMGTAPYTTGDMVRFWVDRILQQTKSDEFVSAVINVLSKNQTGNFENSIPRLIAILAMTPDFQLK